MNWRRLGAWAGMIGTALFITLFLLQGWLQPGYDARRMTISELALGPAGWLHILNIVTFGVLLLIFARGLATEFPTGKASKAGPLLLSIIGICAIGSGVFVTEPTSMPPTQWAWHGWVHVGFALISFLLWPVLAVVFYRRFRKEAEWQALAGWSLLVAVVTALLLVITFFGASVPGMQDFLIEWSGVLQRINTIIPNAWLFALAFKLYERSQLADSRSVRHEEPLGGISNPR